MIFRHDYESIENLNGSKEQNLSGKKIILILSPIFVVLMAITILFLLPTPNPTPNVKNLEPITKLNETYSGDIIVTATDIRTINRPNDETILVGVRFEVKNNSNTSYELFRAIDTYIDDIAPNPSYSGFNSTTETLSVTLMPGKKATGYETVIAPKGSKKIEIQFQDQHYDTCVRFIFDIPPVEQ